MHKTKSAKCLWGTHINRNSLTQASEQLYEPENQQTPHYTNKRVIFVDQNKDILSQIGKATETQNPIDASRNYNQLPISELSKYDRPMFYPFSGQKSKDQAIEQYRLNDKETLKKNIIYSIVESNKEQAKSYQCLDINERTKDYDSLVSRIKITQRALKAQPAMHKVTNVNGKPNFIKVKSMLKQYSMKNTENDPTKKDSDVKVFNDLFASKCLTYTYKADPDFVENALFYPDAREGATMIYDKQKIYYIGGIGIDQIESMCYLQQSEMLWKEVTIFRENNSPTKTKFGAKIILDKEVDPRKKAEVPVMNVCPSSYHSTILYKDNIVMFGGQKQDNLQNSVWVFDTKKLSWSSRMNYGEGVEPRKCHVGCMAGNHTMFVHGGQDSSNNPLNTCFAYNQLTGQWHDSIPKDLFKVETKNGNEGAIGMSPTLSYHTAVSVVKTRYYDNKNREENILDFDNTGLWMFGGKNKKGISTNDLWHVKFIRKKASFTKIEPKGKAPKERFSHQMVVLPNKNYIVIQGGRNDEIYAETGYNCFGDINVLDYIKLVWVNVVLQGESYIPRYSFCATATDYSIVLVGGINNGTLQEQCVYQILFDVDDKMLNTLDSLKKRLVDTPQLKGKFTKLFGSDIFGSVFCQTAKGMNKNYIQGISDEKNYDAVSKIPKNEDLNETKTGAKKTNSNPLKALEPLIKQLQKFLNITKSKETSFLPNPNNKFEDYFQGKCVKEDKEESEF